MPTTKSPDPQTPARDSSASSYVVLARRYRPSQFDQVIGQQAVTRTLQNAITTDRVHHAYLFTGSRGVGKTSVARIMSKALNCEVGATANPCDSCSTCDEIREGRSVDVFEIDGASHTGVDDVRELRESVRYLPARCRSKIYIIDEVHMLSTSAFNALLKTLEEPPPRVVFIFATTEPHKIPATILSRCQRFDFKRVPAPALMEHLAYICEQEQIVVERGGLALIARAAEGSVRDSLSLLDQVIAYATGEQQITTARVAEVLGVADRRVLFELSRALLARDAQKALATVDLLFTSGQDLSQFAQAFLWHLRDLTVVRTCREPGPLVEATEAELDDLEQLSQTEEGALLPQLFERFARATEQIARSSFPRLLLEMAIVEMVHAEPMLPLGDLLERLERMEGRLGGGGGSTPDSGGSGRKAPSFRRRAAPAGGGRRMAPASPAPTLTPSEPAPAPAPPPAPAPAAAPRKELIAPPSNGDAMEVWHNLLNQVEQVQPLMASTYFLAKLLSWRQGSILLGFTTGSFELTQARQPGRLEAFCEQCTQLTGVPTKVVIKELQPEDPQAQDSTLSAMEDEVSQREERVAQLRDEARAHPLTRAAMRELGATIKSITVTDQDAVKS